MTERTDDPAATDPNSTQAFGLLYDRYYPVVKKFIRVIGHAYPECAEDMTQDIFFTLWKQRDRMTAVTSWEGYLFSMVKNRLINEKKKDARLQKALRQLADTAPRLYNNTQEDLNYRESARLLQQAIQGLPPKARIAYLLKEAQGCNNAEIAKRMGISASVAKQHVTAAGKRLRVRLGFVKNAAPR